MSENNIQETPVWLDREDAADLADDLSAWADSLGEDDCADIKPADLRFWASKMRAAVDRPTDDKDYVPAEGKNLYMVWEEVRGHRGVIFEAADEDEAERMAGINITGDAYGCWLTDKVEGGEVEVERYDPGSARKEICGVDFPLPPGLERAYGAVRVNKG